MLLPIVRSVLSHAASSVRSSHKQAVSAAALRSRNGLRHLVRQRASHLEAIDPRCQVVDDLRTRVPDSIH